LVASGVTGANSSSSLSLSSSARDAHDPSCLEPMAATPRTTWDGQPEQDEPSMETRELVPTTASVVDEVGRWGDDAGTGGAAGAGGWQPEGRRGRGIAASAEEGGAWRAGRRRRTPTLRGRGRESPILTSSWQAAVPAPFSPSSIFKVEPAGSKLLWTYQLPRNRARRSQPPRPGLVLRPASRGMGRGRREDSGSARGGGRGGRWREISPLAARGHQPPWSRERSSRSKETDES
jgi:hypothetical protein